MTECLLNIHLKHNYNARLHCAGCGIIQQFEDDYQHDKAISKLLAQFQRQGSGLL